MSRITVSKACDACRRRKVRCTWGQPCEACKQANLQCTFLSVRQKKGRKGDTANVISELRNSQPEPVRYIAPASPEPGHSLLYTSPSLSLDVHTSPQGLDSRLTRTGFLRSAGLLPSKVIDLCTELFFSQMRSTVPILTQEFIKQAASSADGGGESGEEAYCLLCSFCGFVILQTGGITTTQLAQANIQYAPLPYGQLLLREALSARSHTDMLVTPTLSTVVLTFFIYGCHSALGKHRLAWFFLREATTLYTSATLDSNDQMADEALNRLYWLLLISERSHAIRRRRPITLQITPQVPSVEQTVSNDPTLTGFRYLAELFRPIDDNFIALWNRASSTASREILVRLEENLRRIVPPSLDLVETQLANIRVSQQWLRVIVWQLCTMLGFLSSESTDESLTFRYPLKIAQDLAISTWKLPLHSMQMHGIGLTEKVFDIAFTLVDVIAYIPSGEAKASGFEIGPEDNLKHFLSLISQLPGGDRKYLPLLMTKVEQTLPEMTAPLARHLRFPLEENPNGDITTA